MISKKEDYLKGVTYVLLEGEWRRRERNTNVNEGTYSKYVNLGDIIHLLISNYNDEHIIGFIILLKIRYNHLNLS